MERIVNDWKVSALEISKWSFDRATDYLLRNDSSSARLVRCDLRPKTTDNLGSLFGKSVILSAHLAEYKRFNVLKFPAVAVFNPLHVSVVTDIQKQRENLEHVHLYVLACSPAFKRSLEDF